MVLFPDVKSLYTQLTIFSVAFAFYLGLSALSIRLDNGWVLAAAVVGINVFYSYAKRIFTKVGCCVATLFETVIWLILTIAIYAALLRHAKTVDPLSLGAAFYIITRPLALFMQWASSRGYILIFKQVLVAALILLITLVIAIFALVVGLWTENIWPWLKRKWFGFALWFQLILFRIRIWITPDEFLDCDCSICKERPDFHSHL